MSLLLPSELPFGRLEVDETWLEFDGPRLFVASNRTGQAFLFNAIDEDESSIAYLAVPISDQRRMMLRSGGIGLRAAFLRPEEDHVFRVECDYVEGVVRVVALPPEALDEADLPTPDAVISIATDTLRRFRPSGLGDRAAAEGRTLIALRLNPPTLARSEYPTRPLSDALLAVQSLTEALVQEQSGNVTTRGSLSSQVVEDAELSVLELEAASFVTILAPSRSARSTPSAPSLGLEMPATSAALNHMQQLLSAVARSTDDDRVLRSQIEGLGVRALTKIRDLLEITLDQNTPLTVYIAQPDRSVSEVEISKAGASTGVRVLSEHDESHQELVLSNAMLVGVNLRTWVFELHDAVLEPYKFSGRVMEHARSQIEGLPTGEGYRYVAEIVAARSISNLTDEMKVKYSLKAIRPAGPLLGAAETLEVL